MTRPSPRVVRRWLLSAATGLAIFPSLPIAAGEPIVERSLTQEPARIRPSTEARPLGSAMLGRLLPGKSGSAATPVVTTEGRGSVPVLRTADNAAGDGPSAIERELQKLYERDGRKMPPMRKPVVPNASDPARQNQVVPRTNAANATDPTTPERSSNGLQRMNPFGRKTPAASAKTAQPPAHLPAPPPAQITPPPASVSTGVSAASSTDVDPAFQQPPSQQPPTRTAETRPVSVPAADFDNPFPDESETQADGAPRSFRPAPAARQEASSPPVPPSRPEPPPARATREQDPPTQPSVEREENPFTGLKLDDPPRRTVEATPAPPSAPVITPRAETASDSGDFELPTPSRRGNTFVPPPARNPEGDFPAAPERAQPQRATLVAPSPPGTPTLTAPSSNDFEAPSTAPPVRRSEPMPQLTAPSLEPQAPVLTAPPVRPEAPPQRSEKSDFPAPMPREERQPPMLTAPTVSPPQLTAPSTELTAPSPELPPTAPSRAEPQPGVRLQPPKQLNPEPAAELPKIPANEHERKLRLIAQRQGTGFKGFCPVTLRDDRELADALPRFSSAFDGITYSFATAEAKDAFDRNPLKYVPAAGGHDVIIQGTSGRDVPGSLDYAVWYKDRLHLFSSRETLETFIETLSTATAPKP